MPRLIVDAGDLLLALRETQNKAVLPAVLCQPFIQTVLVADVHRQPQLVLTVAGNCHLLGDDLVCLLQAVPFLRQRLPPLVLDLLLLRLIAVGRIQIKGIAGSFATLFQLLQRCVAGAVHIVFSYLHRVGLIIRRQQGLRVGLTHEYCLRMSV